MGHCNNQLLSLLASAALLPGAALAQTSADIPLAGDRPELSELETNPDATDTARFETVIVTAQKRSESLQDTPLAITAVSGDALRNAGIANIDALATLVPGLQIGQSYGSANISLRGISLNAVNFGAENPIAFHIDGVFVARPAAVLSGFYDMQRVEVLRGAQGTLYGRNTTGGSINMITADPTSEFSGYGQFTYGDYDHVAFEGAISGPIIEDKLLFRLSFRTDERDGWGKNEFTGQEIDDNQERAVRAKLLWNATDALSVMFEADYAKADDHQTPHYGGTPLGTPPWGVLMPSGFAPFDPVDVGGILPSDVRNISSDLEPYRDNEFWGTSITIDWALGPIDLKSISAYRGSNTLAVGDLDQTSAVFAPVVLADRSRQLSQEFQISHQGDNSNWIAGLYYFHERDRGHNSAGLNTLILDPLGFAPIAPPGTLVQGYYAGTIVETDAYAVFGQYTQDLTDRLSLTLGARYSIEDKSAINQGAFDLANPFSETAFLNMPDPSTFNLQCAEGLPTIGFGTTPCVPEKSFYSFTPKIGLDYQVTPSILVYASASKGFKSGVYNLGTAQPPVNPEKIWDYEAGMKSTLFNDHLRFNLSGFFYDYEDLQVNKVKDQSVILENAATAEIYGLEVETAFRPTDAIQIDFSGSYLNTEFSEYVSADNARPLGDGVTFDEFGAPAFNLEGNRLPQSPELSGLLGANYTFFTPKGDLTLRGEVAYTSEVYWTPYNLDSTATQPRTRFNASAVFESADKRWTAALNIKNIEDEVEITNGFVSATIVGNVVNAYTEMPRTIDFTLSYNF
ncbi:TonB-dependent receptor [Henriciella mobilis]|nr:TonB-dependent receptor [Henriciella mobilis]